MQFNQIMTSLFRIIKRSNLDERLLYFLLSLLSAFVLLTFILSSFRSMVNADAGYYLGVTELIHERLIPYKDFGLSYTPLFFYVLQLPRLLMGVYPDYTGYMLFLYIIAGLDAYLLSTIVYRIQHSLKFAWLSALVFLLLYLYLDGAYFILETFSLCCGLVSMALLVGRETSFLRCFLSGVFCALAFLSKQYGLLFTGFVGSLLLLSNEVWKNRILHCILVLAGFCTVFFLFVSLFVSSGLGLRDLVSALSGSTYGEQSLGMYADGVIRTCRLFPYLLFVIFILFDGKSHNNHLVWACFIGLSLASLQFYFNVFSHYYIYMLPFVLVLNAMVWKWFKSGFGSPLLFLLYFGMCFTSCVLPLQSVYKDTKSLVKHDIRSSQDITTIQLRQTVLSHDLDSALCFWNTVQYYGLCPIKPAAIEDYSFAFGDDTEDTYIERLRDADCFIIRKSDLNDLYEMTELVKTLSEGFVLLDNEFADGTMVYIRAK